MPRLPERGIAVSVPVVFPAAEAEPTGWTVWVV
jgi:hypothetical protein